MDTDQNLTKANIMKIGFSLQDGGKGLYIDMSFKKYHDTQVLVLVQ